MKVTLVLKGAADFFGRTPVYIRWSNGQKRTFKKTDINLTKEQFARFRDGSHLPKEKDLYTRFLSAMDKQAPSNEVDFYKYCNACIQEWQKEKRPETIRQLKGEVSKLQQFKEDVSLQDITPTFLKDYKAWCYNRGNQTNTVWKSFKFLRLMIRKAYREKLIVENPFDVFVIPKYKETQKQYLTGEQIGQLEAVNNLPNEILFARDWFVIGCYTGLRFGDMAAFNKKEHIKSGRLTLYTSKTGEIISLPLSDKLKALFAKVDYKPVPYTNTHFNRLLKQIDIGVKLNAHLARHSFAMMCATKGISQEVTAKLLGHTRLATTAIYYKITGDRIDADYMKLF